MRSENHCVRLILLALFLVSAAVGLTTCSGPEQQLSWLDSADAVQMLRADVAREQYRFFSVCGYACEVVGVGLNFNRCFSKVASVNRIEGTSDVIVSPEHDRLLRRARTFAEQYNTLLADYLQSHSMSSCTESADWDAAFHQMNKYVSSLAGDAYPPGYVAGPLVPHTAGHDFSVELVGAATIDIVVSQLCKILARNGIEESTSFVLHRRSDPERKQRFTCGKGRVTP